MEIQNKIASIETKLYIWNKRGYETNFLSEAAKRSVEKLKDLHPQKEEYLRSELGNFMNREGSSLGLYKEAVNKIIGKEPTP